MPTRLSRYIAHEYVRLFLLILSTFLLMSVVTHLFANLSELEDWEAVLELLREIALLLIQVLELVTPLVVLLATIATFSSLGRTSELLAMRASGLGGLRMLLPVFGVIAVVATSIYLIQHQVYPWMHKRWVLTETQVLLPPLWKVDGERNIYYFGTRHPDGHMESISVFRWKPDPHRLVERTAIAEGEQSKSSWLFRDVVRVAFTPNHLIRSTQETWEMPQMEMPSVPFLAPISPHHRSLITLFKDILRLQGEGQDVTKHWVEFYQKLAYPVTLWIMALIGFALSATHSRHRLAVESLSLSVLLGILFWMLNQIFLALGNAGMTHPALAAWMANLLFCALGIGLLVRYRV
ncbi:MAG TPA: LptF/LptG family permease [Deltaproteobacteria bacterium]|nr:LptF/LptG family permease [Deltaproteobacteria bacterium]